jgi:hypothetical protein
MWVFSAELYYLLEQVLALSFKGLNISTEKRIGNITVCDYANFSK